MLTRTRRGVCLVVVVLAGACANVTPTPLAVDTQATSASRSIEISTPPSPRPTRPSPTPPSTPTPAVTTDPVVLEVSQTPAFAGDRLTLTISSVTTRLRLESATIDFGDGISAVVTGRCDRRISVEHAYRTAGDYTATTRQVTACDPATEVDVSGASAAVHLFPAAPAASAGWPVCSTFQLALAGPWSGAGLGNIATRITLRNVSREGCTLEGYPDVALVGPGGKLLPTHVTRATTGAYTFPAVVPHRVALGPNDVASFMIGWTDNPFGPAADEPYAVACPASVAVRVTFPGTHQFGTAGVPMGACGGLVDVSPIVPGADGLRFS
ncbi:MAG: DUF4232 domain-containing protein [Chloroflexi bacterium]|nr:DUF4232 domain-containing protein [Chloroflexota bacterium]